MNIHEFQAKALLRDAGALVSDGRAITDASQAQAAAEELGGPVWVVKSQIHAGGRGKGKFKGNEDGAGGVRVVKSVEEVVSNVGEMLGQTLVTHQTGPVGKQVNTIYIEDGSEIKTELYLSMLVDRETSRISFIAVCVSRKRWGCKGNKSSRRLSSATRSISSLSKRTVRCWRSIPLSLMAMTTCGCLTQN